MKNAWDVWHKDSASKRDKADATISVAMTFLGLVKDSVSAARQLRLIEDYEIARALQKINRKRSDRQILNVSADLTSIGGDIATLTGYGASAGVGLKAASAAIKFGAPALRTVKQFGRDRAAKEGAWGITKGVFNAEKSSDKKLAQREAITNALYDRYIALDDMRQASGPTAAYFKEVSRVKLYIRGAGLSFESWIKVMTADPNEGHTMLLVGLAKRE